MSSPHPRRATQPSTAGYSGTPLVRKLGIASGARVGIRRAPEQFAALLQPWPDGATVGSPAGGPLDVIVLFTDRADELAREFGLAARAITMNGALWIAWPKKASKVATDLTEDRVRDIGLAHGLVDVKVCAVTDVWSGLKFVRRLADRE
jgi:hypothetical protein